MIIIKADIMMKAAEFMDHYNRILRQKEEGVILLPPYFDVVTVSEDENIVFEFEERESKIL